MSQELRRRSWIIPTTLVIGILALLIVFSLIYVVRCPDCQGQRTKLIPVTPYSYKTTGIECPTCAGFGELSLVKRAVLPIRRMFH